MMLKMQEEMKTIKAMLSGGSSGPETYSQLATCHKTEDELHQLPSPPLDVKSKVLKRKKRKGGRMLNTKWY
jgi:hypothetical protein